jgi:hypothetical protein
MDSWWNFSHIVLILILPLCHAQSGVYITEPKLLSVAPINSTALNVTWQFDTAIDQSNLVQVLIEFYEFYFNYGPIYTPINYTFTLANKTSTTYLTQNFQLVNAYYYVCFSSNSTLTNTTLFLFKKTCLLRRTCSRLNSSICPQTFFDIISATDISSNAFTININWLKSLPYTPGVSAVNLAANSVTGTQLSQTDNGTYIIVPYRFSGLQWNTSYVVNVIANYTIFSTSMSDVMNYTVSTSRSSNFFYTCDSLIFIAWSVLLSFLFS